MDEKTDNIYKRKIEREKSARKKAEEILEQKSAELFEITQQLKKSNQKLEHLVNQKTSQLKGVFENIIDAYVVIDINGQVLSMNEAATELFGYKLPEELNVVRLIYKEDLVYAMESFGLLLKQGYFTNYKARIFSKDKKVKWVHINASLIYDKDNKAVAAQGIVRDITDSHLNAQLIAEQQRKLSAIVDNSSVGIVLTQNRNIIQANPAFSKFTGYSEEELIKLTVKDISAPEDFDASKEEMDALNAGKTDSFKLVKRYKRKDSTLIWAKTTVSLVRDKDKNPLYQVALIEDITEQRENSKALNTINSVVQSILGLEKLDAIGDQITAKVAQYLNTNDCVVYLLDNENNKLEQISAIGEKIDSDATIKNKIYIELGKGIVGTVAQTGKSQLIHDSSLDERYIVDDQSRFSEITVPIIHNGSVIGVIDSEHSAKRHFNNAQLKTLEQIARLVSIQIASAVSIQQRMSVQQKNAMLMHELEQSNNELTEYAHVVSHDLKSPLRSIWALTNWIKEDNLKHITPTSLKHFDLIESTLERMERLISDVLNYSSLGSDLNDTQKVDIDKLVLEIIKLVPVPEHINIKVKTKLPIIYGDEARLQQLFQNLIINAIKYNDKPNGEITISHKNRNSYVEFCVADNGIGIEKKYHDKIFKMFHVLEADQESSGIGLSVVKKIVNHYKGEIWLKSEPGIGAAFYFTIKK